jgi:hypothetical protein
VAFFSNLFDLTVTLGRPLHASKTFEKPAKGRTVRH